jgi:malate synthase
MDLTSLGAIVVRAGINGDWHAALALLARHGGECWRATEKREVDVTRDVRDMSSEEIEAELTSLRRRRETAAESPASLARSSERRLSCIAAGATGVGHMSAFKPSYTAHS